MSLRRDILREAERRGPFSARLLHRVRELARRGGIEDREALADHLAARFAEAGEPLATTPAPSRENGINDDQ